jgi:hypothetical protein
MLITTRILQLAFFFLHFKSLINSDWQNLKFKQNEKSYF